jgi:exopolysaccharide biosynthesis polyprenyl glycosylphosphotransferase
MKRQQSQTSRPLTLPIQDQPTLHIPSVSAGERRRTRRKRTLPLGFLLALDALLINLTFIGAYYLRYHLQGGANLVDNTIGFYVVPYRGYLPLELWITLGLLAILWLRGAYRLRATGSWVRHFSVIAGSATTGLVVLTLYEFFLTKAPNLLFSSSSTAPRGLIIYTWLGCILTLFLGRVTIALALSFGYRHGLRRARLLVIGSGRLGKMMMQHIAATPRLGYHVIGFIDDQDPPLTHFGRFKALGTVQELDGIIRKYRVNEVLIALPSHEHQQILTSVRLCERAGAEFKLIPDLYELSLSRIDMESIEGIPLIGIKSGGISAWEGRLKRAIDLVISSLILLLGAPLWLLVALAIKLDSSGPVFFKQRRVGKDGRQFLLYKFRSMRADADRDLARLRQMNEAGGPLFKIKADPRRTRIGKLIRRTSIDEIPQLLNVLRGEMSLVGPRPPLPSEVEEYDLWERGRLEVHPGLTGLWQVRGRSQLDFDEMVLLDLYYIENWSLRLDVQILLQTVPAVLFSRGAY